MRQIFIITIFVLIFSTLAIAQQIPDYLFLEVFDSQGNPVEKATVTSSPDGFDSRERKQLTNNKGSVHFYLPADTYSRDLISIFEVIKDGYFTYYDLGGSGHNRRSNAKIELLKIPQTESEKKYLGNEQIKREFMWAVKTGDAEKVKHFLEKGVNPNLTTSDLRGISGRKDVPAILFAALSADGETVKTLLKAGVNIRRKEDPFRSIFNTYLMANPFTWHKFKTEAERKKILDNYQNGAEALLKAGADFDVENERFGKPIFIAAYKGYARVLKILMDKGFSPNYAGKTGGTILEYAVVAERGNPNSKIDTVNLLLKAGANPNPVDQYGCNQVLYGAASTGDVAVIQALLKKGAKVSSSCNNYMFPLVAAIKYGKIEGAKLLIDSGIHTTSNGENALMIAASLGNLELVKMFLDKFPVNDKTHDGSTALFFASDNTEILKVLLKAGANPNVVSKDCLTPLRGSVYSPNILKLLVENGADVNFTCADGTTALSYSVRILSLNGTKALIELGADPNVEAMDKTIEYIKATFNEGRHKPLLDEVIQVIEEARAKKRSN